MGNNFRTFYALSLALQLGFSIAIPITICIFLGIAGDAFFKTAPLISIIGAIAGVSLSAYATYHSIRPFLIKGKGKSNAKH